MALSQKHRTSIYQTLVPILGEEETEALMHEFPATERDELVTRSVLHTELAELRTEIADRLRQQTMWLGTLTVAAVGVAAALS